MAIHLVAPHNKALLDGCQHVANIERDVRPWLPLMIREMLRNDGMGITANQVGETAAVFVTNVPGDIIRIYINPEIEYMSREEVVVNEGCLTFPGKHLHTIRKRHVAIRAFNLSGHEFVVDTRAKIYDPATSLVLSACLQHEFDHIIGIDMREYL